MHGFVDHVYLINLILRLSGGREKEKELVHTIHNAPSSLGNLHTTILLYLSLFSLLTHRSLGTRLRYYHSLAKERPWVKHLTSLPKGMGGGEGEP